MAGLRERKKEATRELLQSTALGLFKKKGYYEVSMRDLAKACDLSLGTFYNYFKTKDEVLTSIIESKILNMYQEWEKSKYAGKTLSFPLFTEQLFLLHVQVLKEFREHLHVLFVTFNTGAAGQAQADLYRKELWDFVLANQSMKFASLTENEQASQFYWGAYLNFLMLWANDHSSGLKQTHLYVKKLSHYLDQALGSHFKK